MFDFFHHILKSCYIAKMSKVDNYKLLVLLLHINIWNIWEQYMTRMTEIGSYTNGAFHLDVQLFFATEQYAQQSSTGFIL